MRIFYPNSQPAGLQPNGRPWPVFRLDQLEAIHRITREVRKGGSALLGAGMGSGKTSVTVEVILKTKPNRCLVVGVKDAYQQWAETLEDQQTCPTAKKRTILQIDSTAPGLANLEALLRGDSGIFYVGLEMLRAKDWHQVSETTKIDPSIKAFFGDKVPDEVVTKKMEQRKTYAKMPPVDLLISDETHRHSNNKTASLDTVRTIPAKAKIALSGTFFGNKFENAWAVTTWLWGRDKIGTKGMWEAEWCVKAPVMSKDGRTQLRSPRGYALSKVVSERNPGEFVETLPCYVFIASPLGDPPPPEVVKSDLHPEQMRQYREMEAKSLTWIPSTKSLDHEPLVADLPVTQRQRLRTAALGGMTLVPGVDEEKPDSITFEPGCKSSTLAKAYEILHRPSWVGKKALILTHSKPFAVEAARRIGQKYSVALKTGDTKKWSVDKANFMKPIGEPGSVQYLVAVISAVGTATDGLQANCAKVLWLSEDDNNANNMQGSNRIWRQGVDLDSYESVKIIQSGTIAEGVLRKNDSHRKTVLDSVKGSQ